MILLFRDRVDVRNEFHAAHERLQSTGNSQALLLLVRLNNATHCALRCAESAVEHVAELDRIVALLTMPTFDVERTSLKVRAVGAGHQLLVLLVPRKPRLKIVPGRH